MQVLAELRVEYLQPPEHDPREHTMEGEEDVLALGLKLRVVLTALVTLPPVKKRSFWNMFHSDFWTPDLDAL